MMRAGIRLSNRCAGCFEVANKNVAGRRACGAGDAAGQNCNPGSLGTLAAAWRAIGSFRKGLKRRTRGDLVQNGDLRRAVPDGDRRILLHYVTRTASRSILSFINGWSAFRVVIVTGIPRAFEISSSICMRRNKLGILAFGS